MSAAQRESTSKKRAAAAAAAAAAAREQRERDEDGSLIGKDVQGALLYYAKLDQSKSRYERSRQLLAEGRPIRALWEGLGAGLSASAGALNGANAATTTLGQHARSLGGAVGSLGPAAAVIGAAPLAWAVSTEAARAAKAFKEGNPQAGLARTRAGAERAAWGIGSMGACAAIGTALSSTLPPAAALAIVVLASYAIHKLSEPWLAASERLAERLEQRRLHVREPTRQAHAQPTKPRA